ncbi:uncharacterized protein MONBRDRAFT_5550 [Monosiga brevicollis MX1]|uniref:SAM domain-containing protein n=1 Tax=Monosiga brevicollis TaxID=81824 RepID=A9URS7_MONBE|nr:uncharacterized protein MONBRDRAFT_5550 [Monosiga brevicollis MX1]EDQ91656.1 predicted protein [Monosiga brevicollis MX1]|eukprot:XP_001742942.1 hypothetical protein [Monosiga brevicollis MX1]
MGSHLRTVDVRHATVPTALLGHIGQLHGLEKLILVNASLTLPAPLVGLLAGWPRLQHLDLGENVLSAEQLPALLSTLHHTAPALQTLGLAGAPVSDELLARLPTHLPKVARLDLSRTRVTGDGLATLLASDMSAPVAALRLQGLDLSEASESELRTIITRATDLDLSGARLGWVSASSEKERASGNAPKRLVARRLQQGLTELVNTVQSSGLVELDLSENSMPTVFDAVLDLLSRSTRLQVLGLDHTELTDAEGEQLMTACLQLTGLRELRLQGNQLSDAVADELASLLSTHNRLRLLDLTNNSLSDSGTEDLASALADNQALQELHLRGNAIEDDGVDALARALTTNTQLRKLALDSHSERHSTDPIPSATSEGTAFSDPMVSNDAASKTLGKPDRAAAPPPLIPLTTELAGQREAERYAQPDEQKAATDVVQADALAESELRALPAAWVEIQAATAANKLAPECPVGALVQDSECVTECGPGYLHQAEARRCVRCSSPCAACSGRVNNCTACAAPLVLSGHRCVAACGPGMVEEPINGTCYPCHDECSDAGCFGPGPRECYACQHFSNEGMCMVHCPKGKSPDGAYRCYDVSASPMRRWLEGLHLKKYADLFHRDRITFELLYDFDDADLKELGVRFSPERAKVRRAVKQHVEQLDARFAQWAQRLHLRLPAQSVAHRAWTLGQRWWAWATGEVCAVLDYHDVQRDFMAQPAARAVIRTARSAPAGEGHEHKARCRRAWNAFQELIDLYNPMTYAARHPGCPPAAVRYSTLNLIHRGQELLSTCGPRPGRAEATAALSTDTRLQTRVEL